MAKCLIKNELGGRSFGFLLPTDAENAKSFCDTHLEGTYAIFEEKSKSGNEEETEVNSVTVTGKATDGRKATISFYAKSNKTEDEIRDALKNKTYNDVEFDEVYIINMSKIKIGA